MELKTDRARSEAQLFSKGPSRTVATYRSRWSVFISEPQGGQVCDRRRFCFGGVLDVTFSLHSFYSLIYLFDFLFSGMVTTTGLVSVG